MRAREIGKGLAAAALSLSLAFQAAAQDAPNAPGFTAERHFEIPDYHEHPLAGSDVEIIIGVEDDAGRTASTGSVRTTIPAYNFTNPIARIMAAQRPTVAFDTQESLRVAYEIDRIIQDFEDQIPTVPIYVALHNIRDGFLHAETVGDYNRAISLMWYTMIELEREVPSPAERRLREAQRALEEALQNGASDEELRERMEELRQAMEERMQEMAEQNAQDQENGLSPEERSTAAQGEARAALSEYNKYMKDALATLSNA